MSTSIKVNGSRIIKPRPYNGPGLNPEIKSKLLIYGYLNKLKSSDILSLLSSYNRRFFTFDGNVLNYYQDEDTAFMGPSGKVYLADIKGVKLMLDISGYIFAIYTNKRTYKLQALSENERNRWFTVLSNAVSLRNKNEAEQMKELSIAQIEQKNWKWDQKNLELKEVDDKSTSEEIGVKMNKKKTKKHLETDETDNSSAEVPIKSKSKTKKVKNITSESDTEQVTAKSTKIIKTKTTKSKSKHNSKSNVQDVEVPGENKITPNSDSDAEEIEEVKLPIKLKNKKKPLKLEQEIEEEPSIVSQKLKSKPKKAIKKVISDSDCESSNSEVEEVKPVKSKYKKKVKKVEVDSNKETSPSPKTFSNIESTLESDIESKVVVTVNRGSKKVRVSKDEDLFVKACLSKSRKVNRSPDTSGLDSSDIEDLR